MIQLNLISGACGATCCLLWVLSSPTLAQTQPSISLPQIAPSRSEEVPYTLGTGDRLKMEIFDVPEYSGEYQVLIDGTLNLPILGSIEVSGLTLEQTTTLISRRYAPYIVEPIVTLSLLSARPINFAVSGEVKRPGTYTIVLTQGRSFPTVTEALELANGITRAPICDKCKYAAPTKVGRKTLR